MTHLFEHQVAGAAFLAQHDRYILGDEVGTGKTRTAITALQLRGSTTPLVICPAVVRGHWRAEFEACDFRGLPMVKSYDEIVRGGNEFMRVVIRDCGVDALIIDESHYLKNADAKRTKIILGRDGYARRLPTVYAISGTPMHRNPLDLWPLFASLFPEDLHAWGLQTKKQFVDGLCIMSGFMLRGKWIEKCVGVKDPRWLNNLLNGVMLRRTVADLGLDVPAVWWQTMKLEGADFSGISNDIQIALEEGWSLDQIVRDDFMATELRKIGELKAPLVAARLAEELEADPELKVVVMAHHRSVLTALFEALRPYGPAYIDGNTAPGAREDEIANFQKYTECRVFIGQQQACMTGITLTAAHRVVLVEPSWVAVENVQAAARVARIGQKNEHCICQIVTLAGTLDEAVVAQHHREIAAVNAALEPIHS